MSSSPPSSPSAVPFANKFDATGPIRQSVFIDVTSPLGLDDDDEPSATVATTTATPRLPALGAKKVRRRRRGDGAAEAEKGDDAGEEEQGVVGEAADGKDDEDLAGRKKLKKIKISIHMEAEMELQTTLDDDVTLTLL